MLTDLIDHGLGMRTVSLLRSRVTLHTMPTSAGYEIRENTIYSWDGRLRGNTPFTVLQHTISGRGSLRYENRNMKIHAGETLLVIIPHNHRYWLEQGDRWEYFWISMNGIDALRIHEMVLNAQGPVLKLKPQTIDRLADCTLRLMKGEGSPPALRHPLLTKRQCISMTTSSARPTGFCASRMPSPVPCSSLPRT